MLRVATHPIDIVSFRNDDLAGCPEGSNPPCQRDVGPIVDAIRKATELGVSVINISLNLKEDPRVIDAVHDAAKHGVTVVLAAGNDGLDKPGNLGLAKAGFPNTVLVGALDAYGQPWKGTNRPEPGKDGYRYVWQLGVEVPTELADGSQVVATGTSFAAPIETARLVSASKQT
jgi:subtilisin family serine protease